VNKGTLDGLRVIDISTVVAGGMASSMFADHGAEVLKIENPRAGDPARGLEPQKEGVSLWHKVAGRNKKSLSLNLSKPMGADILRRLVVDADILIENFRPGTLERWDLSPETLLSINPALVIVRISGYGQSGPYAARPGFGTAAEAMTGLPMRSGFPDDPPALCPMPLADNLAGMFAAFSAMFGIFNRDHGTRSGQVVDISLYEPLFRIIEDQVIKFDQLGSMPQRMGNRMPGSAPRGSFRTKDGRWIALSSASDAPAQRLLNSIGGPALAADPRFLRNADRLNNVEMLEKVIADWISEHTQAEALAIFERDQVSASGLLDISQIFEDPHIRHRNNIVTVEDPELGPVRVPGIVPKFTETPGNVQHLSVAIGSHNDEIYGGRLGISAEELSALASDGVI
jgi:crotonobetainyl-CoA:carnitine CoA-transferase CaiB-like acyl-CoA transferase